MTYRELRRRLERLGCRFDRQASGSHEMWLNPTNERETPIPRHGNRDLATGTLHRIRKRWLKTSKMSSAPGGGSSVYNLQPTMVVRLPGVY